MIAIDPRIIVEDPDLKAELMATNPKTFVDVGTIVILNDLLISSRNWLRLARAEFARSDCLQVSSLPTATKKCLRNTPSTTTSLNAY